MYAYACICTREWVYICTCEGVFCLIVPSNPSTTCLCITGFFSTPARVCSVELEMGFFSICACCWRESLCFDKGRDRGFGLIYFSIFAGVRVVGGCVFVYARTHTPTTWVLDMSPGVRRTPEEPEESRSTKAQYACRPYRCTKYICLYICWAAGFDDLG